MRKIRNFASILFVSFSFLGLILVVTLTNLPSVNQRDFSWRKPLVATAFCTICILGIFAGIRPSRCSSVLHFKGTKHERFGQRSATAKDALVFRGHHPKCENFSAHVFRVEGKVFCAGCIGLILGASLSVCGATLYFLLDIVFWSNIHLVFWIGFVCVSCGILQYHLFDLGKSSIHLVVNTFFVFGVFLLLVGVDIMTQNVVIDFYLIALSLFWLYTRILLSQLDHKKICGSCLVDECELSSR